MEHPPDPGPSSLGVETLGRLAVHWKGSLQPRTMLAPVRSAVLVVLAVEREISREELMALLWPESPGSRARHSLNQALHRLRSDFGEGWLLAQGDRLAATDALTVDVHAFLAAVEEGEVLQATELYGGRFLQGARLANTRPFEDWMDRWDARLAARFRDACREAMEDRAAEGDLDTAQEVARRWLALDPLSQEPNHRLTELLAAGGRVPEALEHVEAYRRSLAEDDLELPEALATLVRRLRASPPPPTPLPIPDAPSEDRHRQRPSNSSEEGVPYPPQSWKRPWRSLLVAAAVVVVAGVGLFRGIADPGPDAADRVVLVAPLQNYTGDSALTPLGRMAADWIGQSAARRGIRVIPTIEVMEGDPQAGRGFSEAARARAVADRLQADLLVTGHYTLEGRELVLRAEVSDLDSSRVWGPLPPVRAPVDSPTVAFQRLEQRVTGLLVSQVGPGFAVEPPTVLHPPTLDAYETFLRGVDRFIRGEYREALPHLARAYELDPHFARAALLAASTHLNLGNPRGADSVARLLTRHEAALAPYEAAHLASLREMLAGDRAAALEAATEAANLAPGGPITAVAALFALQLGNPERALALMSRIDPHQGWAARVPEYWEGRTRILHALGRHQEELQLARSPEASTWPLHSRFWEVRALAALRRSAEIRNAVLAASTLPQDPRLDFGQFLSDAALEVQAHGDSVLAQELFSRALQWHRGRRSAEDADAHLLAEAQVLFRMGENGQALELYRRLGDVFPGRLPILGSLAVLHARLGQVDSARALADELLDPPFVQGEASLWRARVEATLGNSEGARDLARQALQEGSGRRFHLHVDPVLSPHLQDLLNQSGPSSSP